MAKYNLKQKSPENESSYPYYVSSSGNKPGLFSRIKGFFNNSANESQVKSTLVKEQAQSDLTKEQIRENKRKIYNFDNVNVSTIDLSVHSNLSFTSKNPNDTLSEFFNQKGNQPLNDIEIEGVMSLIKKSQSQNSRLPSRNNSFLLNPNMDSKLHGFSSFNDLNNTTILRSASNNLPKPVKIKTPTFVSRSNTTDVYNSSRLNNTTFNNSIVNTSKSFVNASGIRKKRIVNYSTLESPYKLKNHSPLTAYLEKKKMLEREPVLTTKPIESRNTKKPDRIYNGGIIDLSKMEEDDDEKEKEKEKEKKEEQEEGEKEKEVPVKKTLSKTASKVLDILNFEESVNKSKKEKNDIQENKKDNDIITIDDGDLKEVKETKKQILENKSKPVFEPTIVPKFRFNTKLQETNESLAPIVAEQSFKRETAHSTGKQNSSPTPINFSKSIIDEEPKITTVGTYQPTKIEQIDSFTFPEVKSPIKDTISMIGNNITNGNDESKSESESKYINNEPEFEFTFPSVDPISATIKIPSDSESKIYDDVFKF